MGHDHPTFSAAFAARATTSTHPLNNYLYRLMELKKSNLCLSADVTSARELLHLADKVGPYIVVLKTHYDLIVGWDFNPQTGTGARLLKLARKHGFLIFEDRKFGDIGNTVQLQYTSGTARIIDWAHIVNLNMVSGEAAVHALAEAAAKWKSRVNYEVRTSVSVGTPLSGSFEDEEGDTVDDSRLQPTIDPAMFYRDRDGRKDSIVSVTTLTQSFEPLESPRLHRGSSAMDKEEQDQQILGIEEPPHDRGLLILAQMSSAGNLMDAKYTQACIEAAREHKDFVMGFISQETLNIEKEDNFIHMTPGCQLPTEGDEENDAALKGDGLGQQYNTPSRLVGVCGSDIVIVGRGITQTSGPESEAERYRKAAWDAYLKRTKQE